VNSTQLEHVSVIATATAKFGLAPLNERVSATNDLTSCIDPELVGNPQPPAAIPMLEVSRKDLFHERHRGPSQHELAEMIADGRIPLPPDRRHAQASREVAERLLAHAERLGVVKILP
jgi:phospholipase C